VPAGAEQTGRGGRPAWRHPPRLLPALGERVKGWGWWTSAAEHRQGQPSLGVVHSQIPKQARSEPGFPARRLSSARERNTAAGVQRLEARVCRRHRCNDTNSIASGR